MCIKTILLTDILGAFERHGQKVLCFVMVVRSVEVTLIIKMNQQTS